VKKNILVEQIRGLLLKSEAVADNTKVLHYKRVEALVGSAFAELVQVLAKKEEGEIESGYVRDYYSQPVLNTAGMQYVTLPCGIVPLPGGKGVWYIKPTGSHINYTASNQIMTSAFRSIPVSECINDTVFRLGTDPAGEKAIIFQHIGDSQKRSIRIVDYGLVRDFESYNDNDDVHLPNESYSFLIEKIMLWVGQRYNDKQNNGQ